MYKVLNTTAALAILAFAATGDAQARSNHHHHYGYAAAAYSETWPWYARVRNVHGRACGQVGSASDMPDSTCSNAWRINDQMSADSLYVVVDSGRAVQAFTGKHGLRAQRDGLDGECAPQRDNPRATMRASPDPRPTGYPTASAKLYSARVAEPEGLSPDQHECRKLPSSLPRAPPKYRDRSPIKLHAPAHVHHAGSFAQLEDQLCSWVPDMDRAAMGSPDRGDALVWALTELMVDGDLSESRALFTSVPMSGGPKRWPVYDPVHGWS